MANRPVAIITGASSGIGEATARLLSEKRYRVVLAARRLERLEALAQELRAAGGQALTVETDVANLDDLQNLVQTTLKEFGEIDVLFNNAGIGRIDWLERLDLVEDIDAQIQINLTAVIQLTRLVLPHMLARRSGHIINMSSVAGLLPVPTYSVYTAAKYGVRGFTEALRRELKPSGIHVSGLFPGGVNTAFREESGRVQRSRIRTPDFLRLSAEDVAQAVWSLIRRPRRALVMPWPMKMAAGINGLFPGLVERVIEVAFARKARELGSGGAGERGS
jgi:short-subunit dehydrogenase